MITFGHAEFAQLILEVLTLLQDRALLRGFNRKTLIVYFVSGLMLKGRQRAQRRDNHLTGAGLRHGLRVVVVPWSAVISDVDRSGVDCAGDCVVGTECGGESRRTNSGAAT